MRPTGLFSADSTPQNEPPKRGRLVVRILAVGMLAVVALGVRAAYWTEIHDDPSYLYPRNHPDVLLIFNEACRLSNAIRAVVGWAPFDYSLPPTVPPDSLWRADGYFRHTKLGSFIRPPAYTIFLAVVYAFSYEEPQVLLVVQMLVGLATLVLLFLFARHILGFWPAWLATLFLSVNWTTLYYESIIHAPILTGLLMMIMLCLLILLSENPKNRWFLASGAAFGLVCLAAPAMPVFAPVLGAWTAWVLYGHERRRAPAELYRMLLPRWAKRTVMQGMLMLAAMLAVILPITASNYAASGKFTLISPGFWFHVAIANYPGLMANNPSPQEEPIAPEDLPKYQKIKDEWERTESNTPGAMRVEDAWSLGREAIMTTIARNPARFVKYCVLRTFWFWAPWEYAGAYTEAGDRLSSVVLSRLPWWFGWVTALATAGLALLACDLVRTFRQGQRMSLLEVRLARQWLPVLVVAAWLFPYVISKMCSTYRIPILPLLFLFAGFAVYEVPRRLTARRWVSPFFALACATLVMGVNLTVQEPVEEQGFPEIRIVPDLKEGNVTRALRKVDNYIAHSSTHQHEKSAALRICSDLNRMPTAVAYYGLAFGRHPEDTKLAELLDESVLYLPLDADIRPETPRETDEPGMWLGYGLALLRRCDLDGAEAALERIAPQGENTAVRALAAMLLRILREDARSAAGIDVREAVACGLCPDAVFNNAVDSLDRCGHSDKAARLAGALAGCSSKPGELHVREARLWAKADRVDRAIDAYVAAIGKGVVDMAGNELRELAEVRVPQAERAALWRRVLEHNPTAGLIHLFLAAALTADGNADEALAEYREACRLDGTNKQFQLSYAESLAASGNVEEALAWAEKTEPLPDYLRPAQAAVYSAAGRSLASKSDWDRAVTMQEKAVSIVPKNPWYKCWLAEALIQLGHDGEARRLLLEVTTADPANPLAQSLLHRVGGTTLQ